MDPDPTQPLKVISAVVAFGSPYLGELYIDGTTRCVRGPRQIHCAVLVRPAVQSSQRCGSLGLHICIQTSMRCLSD
jgi:hypothetical protein